MKGTTQRVAHSLGQEIRPTRSVADSRSIGSTQLLPLHRDFNITADPPVDDQLIVWTNSRKGRSPQEADRQAAGMPRARSTGAFTALASRQLTSSTAPHEAQRRMH